MERKQVFASRFASLHRFCKYLNHLPLSAIQWCHSTKKGIQFRRQRGKTQKSLSSLSTSLKGKKELDGGAMDREVLLYFELTPSVIRSDGDDVIVIFRVAGIWTVQELSCNMTNAIIQD